MEMSESIKDLAAALAKAQGEMKPAEMTATNPFLKNKYADLGEVVKAAKPTLAKYGLAVVQPVSSTADSVTVTTLLMHESGQWIRETAVLPLGEARGKSLAQEAGSIITYLRRYSLAAMIGMYADEDTDGNEGAKPANGKAKPEAPAHVPPAEPTNGQVPVDERPNQKLLDRWMALVHEANTYNIPVQAIDPARITAVELMKRGKALKAAIEQAEAGIEAMTEAENA